MMDASGLNIFKEKEYDCPEINTIFKLAEDFEPSSAKIQQKVKRKLDYAVPKTPKSFTPEYIYKTPYHLFNNVNGNIKEYKSMCKREIRKLPRVYC